MDAFALGWANPLSGRPSKYDPSYCDAVVAHCVSGASLTSFAAEIDVSRDTISEWVKTHREFSVAVSRAKAKAGAWYDRIARKIAETNEGNATICMFGLCNMAPEDFRKEQTINHQGAQPVTVIRESIVRPGDTDA